VPPYLNTSFLLVTLPLSAEESLVLGIGEWNPLNSKDLPGNGIASQIVTEAFKGVDIGGEYKYYPWQRAYQMTFTLVTLSCSMTKFFIIVKEKGLNGKH